MQIKYWVKKLDKIELIILNIFKLYQNRFLSY